MATQVSFLVSGPLFGVLLEAKKRGLIGPLKPLLLELQKYGIYMSKPLIEEALEQAGETQNNGIRRRLEQHFKVH